MMKKIVLAAALVAAAGSAFAGSDHFDPTVKANSPFVDNSYTTSIGGDNSATASADEMMKANKPGIRATNKIQPQFEH
jgi:hypothetical protein